MASKKKAEEIYRRAWIWRRSILYQVDGTPRLEEVMDAAFTLGIETANDLKRAARIRRYLDGDSSNET